MALPARLARFMRATRAVPDPLVYDFRHGGSVLPGAFTFARPDFTPCATRIAPDGAGSWRVETVPANVPRIDVDPITLQPIGLRIEEAHANQVLHSRTAWTLGYNPAGVVATPNYAPAPDGLTSWTRIQVPAANAVFNLVQPVAAGPAGTWRVESFWIQCIADMPGSFNVYAGNGQSTGGVSFRLTVAGGKVTAATMNPGYSNGLGIVRDYGSAQRVTLIYLSTLDSLGENLTFSVNGAATGCEFLLWQRQQGAGRAEQSDIFTDATPKTRQADDVLLALPGYFSPNDDITAAALWRGGLESSQGGYGRVISTSGVTTFIARNNGNVTGSWNGTTSVNVAGLSADPALEFVRTITTQSRANNRRFVAGPTGRSFSGAGANTWATLIGIGRNAANRTNMLNGHIAWLKFWPRCLSDNDALTEIA